MNIQRVILFFWIITLLNLPLLIYSQTNKQNGVEYSSDLKNICDGIVKNKKLNDSVKAYLVYRWIITNIKYDEEGAIQSRQRSYDTIMTLPKNVLKYKKGVCWGIGKLYQSMCNYLGIPCETIYGYVRGLYIGDDFYDGKEYHTWNILQFKGKRYQVDCSYGLDDGCSASRDRSKRNTSSLLYFCTPPEKFIINHFADSSKNNLGFADISMEQFLSFPFVQPSYFGYFDYSKNDVISFLNKQADVRVFLKPQKQVSVLLQQLEKCDIQPIPTESDSKMIPYDPVLTSTLQFSRDHCYQVCVVEKTKSKGMDWTFTTKGIARIYGSTRSDTSKRGKLNR